MPLYKQLKHTSHTMDRKLGKMMIPLTEKCGGTGNLFILATCAGVILLIIFISPWKDHPVFPTIIALSIVIMAAKIFTRSRIRSRSPWWYKE